MANTTTRRGALTGVRVLDFSHQAAGPWCTTLLGDMGADVVKIEKPGRGDSIRYADRSGRLPPEIGGVPLPGPQSHKPRLTTHLRPPPAAPPRKRAAPQAAAAPATLPPRVHAPPRLVD